MRISVILFVVFAMLGTSRSFANLPLADMSLKTAEEDQTKIEAAQIECENLKVYAPLTNLSIQCFDNAFYFESNANSKSDVTTGTLRISNFNLLHPGTSKTMFKDYVLMAKMINHFDLVSGNELLGLVGTDATFNKSLMKFMNEGPALLQKYQAELKTASATRAAELNKKIKKLKNDMAIAPGLYRVPGYVKVLKELRALDASWSLVISPRGDSTLLGSVEEFVGFFYRKSRVNLATSSYCSKYNKSTRNEACLITMRDEFSVKNSATYFSRRPMIAKFSAGNLKFSYVTSHVVFNAFGDEDRMNEMLQAAFGTTEMDEIGNGINEVNYARWVEMMLISRWMGSFKKKYPQEKLLYGGDTNLVSDLDIWPVVLKKFSSDAVLGNSEKTTLTTRRFNSKNEETMGLANDYDHFIFKPSDFSQCKPAKSYNFFANTIGNALRTKYLIRDEANLLPEKSHYVSKFQKGVVVNNDEDETDPGSDVDVELDYRLTKQNEKKMNALLNEYRASISSDFQVKNNELVIDEQKIEEKVEAYKVRVFIKQLTNLNFYKVYQEVLSDHLPISMDCSL